MAQQVLQIIFEIFKIKKFWFKLLSSLTLISLSLNFFLRDILLKLIIHNK